MVSDICYTTISLLYMYVFICRRLIRQHWRNRQFLGLTLRAPFYLGHHCSDSVRCSDCTGVVSAAGVCSSRTRLVKVVKLTFPTTFCEIGLCVVESERLYYSMYIYAYFVFLLLLYCPSVGITFSRGIIRISAGIWGSGKWDFLGLAFEGAAFE